MGIPARRRPESLDYASRLAAWVEDQAERIDRQRVKSIRVT
jgi:hypothetical protein